MSRAEGVRWEVDGWRGWARADLPVAPADMLRVAGTDDGRRSRHARTKRVELGSRVVYVKAYPAPGERRAWRAFRMGESLGRCGLQAPEAVLVGGGGGAGILVTHEVDGRSLIDALAGSGCGPVPFAAKRRLLAELGRAVARLHDRGFVHGDLVPTNLLVASDGFVFLDNDRTRHSPLLVWWQGRRNLVQLGRFVVPGLTLADRARVLAAYARARGLTDRARRRLAGWLVGAISRRRCRIDGIAPEMATRVGFRTLMRSGGPFDRGVEPR